MKTKYSKVGGEEKKKEIRENCSVPTTDYSKGKMFGTGPNGVMPCGLIAT